MEEWILLGQIQIRSFVEGLFYPGGEGIRIISPELQLCILPQISLPRRGSTTLYIVHL